jgi:putative RecB family exonuclease
MIAPADAPVVRPPNGPPVDPVAELLKTISASRLGCWQQCRLKFWFRYVVRLQKPPTPALHFGSVVHAVLQAWNLARWRRQPFITERFKQLFDQQWPELQKGVKIRWEGEEEDQRKTAWASLETYWIETPIKNDERPEAVEVWVEADLSRHGLPTLVGILDLVRAGGRIVDFKTSGKTPDAEQVLHQHETQLSGYAVLYREATGKREGGMELHHLIKLKTPKVVIAESGPMTERQRTRLFRAIESYVDGLRRRDFVPSPGLACSFCEYFNECRAWTGAEPPPQSRPR